MNEPLYAMEPGDREWGPTLLQELDEAVGAWANSQDGGDRWDRKMRELHFAFHKMLKVPPDLTGEEVAQVRELLDKAAAVIASRMGGSRGALEDRGDRV